MTTAAAHQHSGLRATRRAPLRPLAPVARSEWLKLRTTRSTWCTAAAAGLISVTLGSLHCQSIASMAHIPSGADPVAASQFGISVGQFVAALAGVLIITGEYAGATIHTTLLATPQRVRLFAAKVAVTSSAAFGYGLVVAVASYGIGQAILAGRLPTGVLTAIAIRQLLGAAAIFTAMALIGFAFGTIARHTAGALTAIVALLVLPTLTLGLLSSATRQDINQYLPLRAADALVKHHPDTTALHPLPALVVLTAEITALLTAAAVLLTRRDA